MEQIVAAALGSSVLTALINQIFNLIIRSVDKKSGVQEANRLLMKDKIRHLCTKYIDQGWIYADELEDLIAMHECYHDKLKGNGFLDELMSDVKKLPVHGIGVH